MSVFCTSRIPTLGHKPPNQKQANSSMSMSKLTALGLEGGNLSWPSSFRASHNLSHKGRMILIDSILFNSTKTTLKLLLPGYF